MHATLSVIIPAHNPDQKRIRRVLEALRCQDLPITEWELIVVDNASDVPLDVEDLDLHWHASAKVIREEAIGLTHARIRGFREAIGELCVLVDDDNLLAADYLSQACTISSRCPDVELYGGKSLPEFVSTPPSWIDGLWPLLALRDDGNNEVIMHWEDNYPSHAPIGAGMVIRRRAALEWAREVERDPRRWSLDRTGSHLASGGDNDIVITTMKRGGKAGYFPSLILTHLISLERCQPKYLERLNREMSKSWMRVLTIHGINSWEPIAAWTAPLRKAKAWFTHRGWSGPVARIRWAGACGHFEGRVQD